jgi:DNA-binding MarR family transcriptional regulator
MNQPDHAADAAANWQRLHGDIDLSRYLVAMRIMRLSSVLQTKLDRELVAAGFTVLGDYDVMSTLRRAGGPLLPSDIADRLRMTRAGITGRLKRLEAAGFVERQRSDNDSRNVLVCLTTRGRTATDRAFDRVVACEDDMFGELSPADVAKLGRILAKLGADHDPAT